MNRAKHTYWGILMPSISSLRAATRVALLSTTALVALPSAAFSIDYVIDDPTTSTVVLGLGPADTLLLTTDTGEEPDTVGSITSVSPGVAVIDVADSITVDLGSVIAAIDVGIEIEGSGTDLTGGIMNDGLITAGSSSGIGYAIEIEEGADISGGITNTGLILGEDTAIVLSGTFLPGVSTTSGTSGGAYSGGSISGGIINTGTIVGEDFGGIVAYSGGTISGGIVNGEDGEILGPLAGIIVGPGGDIAGSTASAPSVVAGIENAGNIEGEIAGIGVGGVNFSTSGFSGTNPNRFGADISGGINNTGTIFGEGVAIATILFGDISGGIVNGEDGVIGLSTDFVAGSTSGTEMASVGIAAMFGGAISGGIDNSGTIFGEYAGISGEDGSMIGGIVNNAEGTIGQIKGEPEFVSDFGIVISNGSVLSSTAPVPTPTDIMLFAGETTSAAAVGITNAGVIVGEDVAIYVEGSGADIAGALVNEATGVIGENTSGSIASYVGIDVDNSGAISGGISNQGFIVGEDAAISVASNAYIGGIDNSGTIGQSANGSSSDVSEFGILVKEGGIISSTATAGGIEVTSTPATVVGITNSGIIAGTQAAILVDDVGSDISGGIVNETSGVIGENTAGTVYADIGIEVRSGGAITGGIDNSGVIFGEDYAVFLTNNAVVGGIVNNSSGVIGEDSDGGEFSTTGIYVGSGSIISTTASPATGIILDSVFAGATSAVVATGITNSGVIIGDDFGIYLDNDGTIGATSGVGISNLASGTIRGNTAAIRINGTLNGGLSNAGLIQGDDFAIEISGSDAEISGDIVNWGGGTITAEIYGIAILDGASVTTNIINHVSGSILATYDETGVAAIFIGEDSTLTGNIQNSGTIESTSSGAGIAIRSSGTLAGSLLNNSGTIEGEDYAGRIIGDDYGVYVSDGGEITGGISNAVSAVIYGGDTGIAIVSGGSVSEGISNSGTIEGGSEYGILVSGSSSVVSGGISNTGSSAVISGSDTGIAIVSGGSVTGGISNSGRIEGTEGHGIMVSGSSSSVTGGISNSGSNAIILGYSDNGISILSGGSVAGGISNSGTIEGDVIGILVSGSSSLLTGNIVNSGSIIGGSTGIRLQSASTITGSITNSGGLIEGETYGIRVSSGSVVSGITNTGTIRSTDGGTGIYVSAGSSVSTVTNSGTIEGDGGMAVQFGEDVSTLTLQTGSDLIGDADGGSGGEDTLILEGYGTEDSTFTEFEALIVNADTDGTWSLTDETTEIAGAVTVNSGTLLITGNLVAESAMAAEGADIDVEGTLDLGSGTLIVNGIVDGSGTISGAVTINGILSPGNSPGVLTIGGPLLQTTGSTYIVEHDANHVGVTQTDRTDVTAGSATIQSGVTVQLDVAPGTDGFADDILTASGGVIGTYDELVINEDNLVALIVYPDANTVSIVAGKTDAIVATVATVSDAGFVFLENLQEGARRDGNLWATGYLYNAEHEGLGANGADFDQDAWGFNVGMDIISEPNLKVGLAVGYMDGDIDIDSATSEAENDGLFGAAYLNYMNDDFYLDGTLMVGMQSVDTTRTLTTGDASGSTDATSYGANLEAGLQLAALGGRLSPFVKVGIHSASIDSYSESGADGAMTVGEVDTQQTRLGAGLRYEIDLGSPDGIQVTPALKVGVTQQWNGGDSSADVGFVGYTGSTTASLDFEDQTTIDLGVSFDVKLSEAVTAFAGWDAALGDESSRNTGTIGLSISW